MTELLPHYVCLYLYELAQEFNRFYEKCRIIGDEREVVRLELTTLYRDTLARGLRLLGIVAPPAM
jgi:arginyl-tRNA synthetase